MLKRVTKALPYLLLAPAFLPLLFIDGLLYPYVTPKALLLRGFGILLFAALAFLKLSGAKLYFDRLRSKVTWIPAALLAVAYVTSFFGPDFYHSFWSIFDRGDGLLTFSVIVAYFYAFLIYADQAFFDRFCRVIAWVGSLVGLYVALQWLQDFSGMNIPIVQEPNGRFGGTLGNAAFLAAYLGMTLFVTLIAAPQYRGKWLKAVYVGAALQLLAILISATRGTILALAMSVGVAFLYVAWKGKGKLRTYARAAVAAGLVVLALFFVFRQQLANAPIEPVRRMASISITEATVSSRLFVWQNMAGEAMQSPILGYGSEHVDILFNRFYDPSGILEQWFDRAHNVYLDYQVQYGIFGLALYLALIVTFGYAAIRHMKEDERVGGLLALLVLTYAIQNFFVFDTSMSLWLFLVLAASLFALRNPGRETALRTVSVRYLPHGVAIAILVLVISVTFLPLAANLALAQGYRYHIADPRRAVSAMEWGLSLGTYADLEYGYQAYQMYTERQVTMLSGSARVIAYQYAAGILGKNYARYPYDARTVTYYAHVLDSAPPEVPIDEDRLREVIAHAQELSPKRIQPWYLLANISLRKGDKLPEGPERNAFYEDGIRVLSEYSATVPDFAEPYYVIATLYQSMGDMEQAIAWADRGLSVYKRDAATARRAARYYVNIEDWPNAARFLEDSLENDEENYPILFDLAKAKFLGDDVEGAQEIVARLQREAPLVLQQDPAFMQAIQGE